jgi:tetratricopeptide (TPR) repeat protein
MILLLLFFNLDLDSKIDSLKNIIHQAPQVSSIIELNKCYFLAGKDSLGIVLLREYYDRLGGYANALIALHLADDYLYTGDMLKARSEYLRLANRYPGSEFANDALERLYMIERARADTIKFKSLCYSIFLFHSDQSDAARDSLKPLVKTRLGDYALYYLALTYIKLDDLPQALTALDDLNSLFPEHKIHNAILLQAEVYIDLDKINEARTILEELIVRAPNSIYAVKARALLENRL